MNTADTGVQGRYLTLDAMRGFAALAVATFHFDNGIIPGGFKAVDFFFLLSGFILTRTYADRLSHPGSIASFARVRALRLMPMHAIGVALGSALLVHAIVTHGPYAMTWPHFGIALLLNLALLPSPSLSVFFPTNPPAWSLFAEMVASLSLPAILKIRSNRAIVAFSLVAAVGLGVAAMKLVAVRDPSPLGHAVGGAYWHFGLLRTLVSFPLGVAIARVSTSRPRRATGWAVVLPVLLVAAIWPDGGSVAHLAYAMFSFLVLFPALVWVGSRLEPTGIMRIVAGFVGRISFAVYAVHWTVNSTVGTFLRDQPGVPSSLALLGYLLLTVGLAWLVTDAIEPPVRRRMRILLDAIPARGPAREPGTVRS